MTIHTKQQLEQVRDALERRSPKELAAFILSLAQAPNGMGNYVHAFAVAEDPGASADLLRAELACLCEGERDYDDRHRRGADFMVRVRQWLDAIESIVRPADPVAAFALLARFIESAERIGQHCQVDDSGAAEAVERARRMLSTVADTAPGV